MNKEKFREVRSFEGYYKVGNHGSVYSIRSNKMLKQRTDKDGYKGVKFSVDNNVSYHRVHRLVYEGFIGELDRTLVIDHIDNNPSNNNSDNLRQISTRLNTSRGKQNKTGLRGVRYFRDNDNYGAEIQLEDEVFFLGVYKTKERAKIEYDKALSNWKSKGMKPFTIKEGYKMCRICNIEKKLSEFRKTKTMKGTPSFYYACFECEREMKRDYYLRTKK